MKLRTALPALLFALALLAAPSAHASADGYLHGVTRVSAVVGPASTERQKTPLDCGTKQAIGGGGDVDGGGSAVALRSDFPRDPDTSPIWFSAGEETTPVSANWSFFGYGYCSDVGAPSGGVPYTDARYVSDVEVVGASSIPGSATFQSATATCAAGKQAIGGGADVDDGGPAVALRSSEPGAGSASWIAWAEETQPVASNWKVNVRVICARIDAPAIGTGTSYLKDLRVVEATSPSTSNTSQTATATCPAGFRSIGGGADIEGGNSAVALRTVAPTDGNPAAFYGWAEETTPIDLTWSIRVRAVCSRANAPAPLKPPAP